LQKNKIWWGQLGGKDEGTGGSCHPASSASYDHILYVINSIASFIDESSATTAAVRDQSLITKTTPSTSVATTQAGFSSSLNSTAGM